MSFHESEMSSLSEDLLKQRQVLLDLSTRNRLLNVPMRTRNVRTIEIVDEISTEAFHLLSEGKSLSFLPGRQLTAEERAELDPDDKETGGIPQPGEGENVDERGIAFRHTDSKLQTRLTSEGLQKRLFDIWYDARTMEEEQGVNVLYLALGLLVWYDDDHSEIVRHAPLTLLPVQLDRTNAGERFKLKGRHEALSANLTLQAKLKADFGITLEDLDDEDEVDLAKYFAHATEAIHGQTRWKVLPNAMVLGFFSFSKFLMYRDLDPANWPAAKTIEENSLVQALLRDGFPASEPLIPDTTCCVDPFLPAATTRHVVDADSSQAIAIEEAARGRTLVIKGPPGTGKSQTITNIIAAAVSRGKTVLFVAEKLAALDVVHRRLQAAGLGALALELHSSKSNKRTVLEELKRTRELALRSQTDGTEVELALDQTRQELNEFVQRLHTPLLPCQLSPYQILGRLGRHHSLPPAAVRLRQASSWSPSEVQRREQGVAAIRDHLRLMGSPSSHLWRGARCGALDPHERRLLEVRLQKALQTIDAVIPLLDLAERELSAPPATDLRQANRTLACLQAFEERPPELDRSVFANPGWNHHLNDLEELISAGEKLVAARTKIKGIFSDAALEQDLTRMRTVIETRGRSLFRFLDGDYRHQIATLKSYLLVPLPGSYAERIELLSSLQETQKRMAAFQALRQFGSNFGVAWAGESSDWQMLRSAVDWRKRYASLSSGFMERLARTSEVTALEDAYRSLSGLLPAFTQQGKEIVAELDLDLQLAFKATGLETIPLAGFRERIASWLQGTESLTTYLTYFRMARQLEEMGLQELCQAIALGEIPVQEISVAFQAAYADALRTELFQSWPALKEFDGEQHGRTIGNFKALDRQRMDLAKAQIARMHADGRPNGMAVTNSPLAVLLGELAKKSRHLSIRQLIEKAGPAVQGLKPVFMMSPLSVAQFLRPGSIEFDLLLIDEASQVEPVDALGAIARSRQMVIVGDERQLPPTRFFAKLTSNDSEEDREEEDATFEIRDAESVLDLCLAKGVPDRMLSWHYRSRHQSLIAVSNQQFYRNQLFIVPSPYSEIAGMGLKFHLLKDAPYDRGKSRTNPVEARTIAEAVMRHAREFGHQSLGVATFSVAQRKQILNELEILRRQNSSLEPFFEKGGNEPFFVKNLENIQGDERDVIFISVGYGKTETGYLAHGFGPLSTEGGERRLNVLISRAKIRCEVFSNFQGADIDLERTRSKGVAAFKMFLTFAETGRFEAEGVSQRAHDSVFEEDVAEQLQARGYDVRSQIGAAGFFIDLAVADPEKPGRFVLGIECDGAQYHSSRSARDRDRLRQQVLEAQGWIIHRVWSADWYLRPEREMEKLQTAIEAAKAEWRERDEAGLQPVQAVPYQIEADHVQYIEEAGANVEPEKTFPPYLEASFSVDSSKELHEIPIGTLMEYLVKIVDTEGPIHLDEIVTRLRTIWGLQRAGNRIRSRITDALAVCRRRNLVIGGPFYEIHGKPASPRNRSAVRSTSLRRPEYLPPTEADAALMQLVHESYGAPREELISATGRMFGFGAMSSNLREVLGVRIDALIAAGFLEAKDGMLLRSAKPLG